MKKLLVLPFLLVLQLSFAQKLKKADRALVNELQKHISVISGMDVQGKRAYISECLRSLGLNPVFGSNFVQEYTVFEEVRPDSSCSFVVNGIKLDVKNEFFPLAYSGSGNVDGEVTPDLKEGGMPWFATVEEVLQGKDIKSRLEMDRQIREMAGNVKKNGGTALIIHGAENPPLIDFDKNDTSEKVEIPVVYITKKGWEKYFSGNDVSYKVKINPEVTKVYSTFNNVAGALNGGNSSLVSAASGTEGIAALLVLAKMVKSEGLTDQRYAFLIFSADDVNSFGKKLFSETYNVKVEDFLDLDAMGSGASGNDATPVYLRLKKMIADLKAKN